MAVSLNFRSALSGFNREDVVHYIEYMNSKHSAQISQLNDEIDELRGRLAELTTAPDLSQEVAALKSQLEAADARQAALEQENARLAAEAESAQQQNQKLKAEQAQAVTHALEAMELEAYRRAEQAERSAKARAEQIYQQATGTLAQATTQVDGAAMQFKQVSEQMTAQMVLLQQAVDSSRNALLDAATTMYAIRPEDLQG